MFRLFYREESKQEGDLDEPWIMTVKGLHINNYNKQAALMGEEQISSPIKHNGSSNGSSRDSNLNPYKLNQVGICHFRLLFKNNDFLRHQQQQQQQQQLSRPSTNSPPSSHTSPAIDNNRKEREIHTSQLSSSIQKEKEREKERELERQRENEWERERERERNELREKDREQRDAKEIREKRASKDVSNEFNN